MAKRVRQLAELIEPCLGRVVAKQGFSGADILVSWPEIVGERLGALSQPVKVDWPRRPRDGARASSEPGALVVRAESAAALELQHLAPLVIERVNAFYGWRCIGRLVLKQAPVGRRVGASARRRILGEPERRRIDDAVAGIDDEGLKAALDRLGSALLGAAERPVREDAGVTSAPQSA